MLILATLLGGAILSVHCTLRLLSQTPTLCGCAAQLFLTRHPYGYRLDGLRLFSSLLSPILP
jgi:hypothetical protein